MLAIPAWSTINVSFLFDFIYLFELKLYTPHSVMPIVSVVGFGSVVAGVVYGGFDLQ